MSASDLVKVMLLFHSNVVEDYSVCSSPMWTFEEMSAVNSHANE